MALEDFNMEQDRRLNTAITEVAILKEQVTNTRSSLDEIKKGSEELKRGQTELIAAVAKGNASNDRMEATLKYSINDQIWLPGIFPGRGYPGNGGNAGG